MDPTHPITEAVVLVAVTCVVDEIKDVRKAACKLYTMVMHIFKNLNRVSRKKLVRFDEFFSDMNDFIEKTSNSGSIATIPL